jgi:AcrR family transcriptional regulator
MPKTRAREQTRRARRDLYRGLILDAAEHVFAERGFDSAKIQEVAEEAGIALGTLYKSFAGKAEIFRSIHEQRSGELIAQSEPALRDDVSPLRALLDYTSAYLQFLVAHPDYLRMHLAEASAWGFGGRFESRVQADAWQRGHEAEAALFRRGIELGLFVERDPSLLVRMMASIQQVQLAHWVERGMERSPDALLAEMRVDLVRAFCRPEVTRWLESSPDDQRVGAGGGS